MVDRKEELREAAKNSLPDPVIIIGYMEHYIDLIAQLVVDLAESGGNLSLEAQERLKKLQSILQYTSVDFNNLNHPFESYKLPSALKLKMDTRNIQKRYLDAQLREGLL